MVDWTSSMKQTFEYYIVDPSTWKDVKLIDNVVSCTINRDADADTLGSASFDIDGYLGECYIRVYLITIQNGVTEKHPLGTFLVQTPSTSFDGRSEHVSIDAYTPLLELKENSPAIGYYVAKDENIMDISYRLTKEHLRAPVVKPNSSTDLFSDFVAGTDDTWLSFLSDLILNDKYRFGLDDIGRILFEPNQDTASLQPVFTYDDGNGSILYPSITVDRDLYGIPNIVEVIYSTASHNYSVRVVNDNVNSPVSTISRGREIVYRETDITAIGNPINYQIDDYAKQLLRDLSTLEYTVSYTHGYCPVRLNDCVRLNYPDAGLNGVKAKVISQNIKCEPGCPVTEKAIFTSNLWR